MIFYVGDKNDGGKYNEENKNYQHKRHEQVKTYRRMRRVPDIMPVGKQDFMQRCKSALRAAQRKIKNDIKGAA